MPVPESSREWFVQPVDFLAELPDEAFDLLCSKANRMLVKAGEVLFRQNEPADFLYVVMSGTLAVFLSKTVSEERRMIALVGKGEVIGEVAVVGGGRRSADVIALRDTDLLRIDQSDFQRLVDKFPEIAFTVAKILAARFREATRSPILRIHPKVTSFIAASPGVDVVHAATRMAEMLKKYFGFKVFVQECSSETFDGQRLTALEDSHDFVILCADPTDERWTNRCTRQSDRLCLIANAGEEVLDALKGSLLGASHDHQMVDLYLLHESKSSPPKGTARILNQIAVNRYFHICNCDEGDWRRWARTLTGRGVGLVFSGGGARAYAHLGVLRALLEAKIPIDFVGGTSMGGIVAAAVASGWSIDEIETRIHRSFVTSNPLSDYTLPLQGLVGGRKVEQLLRESFGDVEINDLWLPFFCVSTNLTNAKVHIHETGLVRKALRASISLPGILPPVVQPEGVLVDGAAINNLPAIEMSRVCHGPIIGIDVSRDLALHPEQWQAYLDRPLIYRLFWPPVISLLLRSGTVSGDAQYRQQAEAAHINITPPLGEIDITNWKKFDKAVELGYTHTVELFEKDATMKQLLSVLVNGTR